jgi:predicted extracellular nuclease
MQRIKTIFIVIGFVGLGPACSTDRPGGGGGDEGEGEEGEGEEGEGEGEEGEGEEGEGEGGEGESEGEDEPRTPGTFFSEYVEGTDRNKAIEITNARPQTVDLAACQVVLYVNGDREPSQAIALGPAELPTGGVYLLCNRGLDPACLGRCEQTDNLLRHNGDDTLALICGGRVQDVFGQIGVQPVGGGWPPGAQVTADHTLRRRCGIQGGDPDGTDPFDPAEEWEVLPKDTLDDLGSHCVW